MTEVAYAQSFLDQVMASRGECDERGNDSPIGKWRGFGPPCTSNVSHSNNKQMGWKKVGKFSEMEKVTILNKSSGLVVD